MQTKIISAFPACGKTYMFKNCKDLFNGMLDSDSSEFSWVKDINGDNTKERNPEFPNNYIKHIKNNLGKVEIIFVSSHGVVRDALKDNGIDYTIVYPNISQKQEWINRFKNRGNNEGFINFLSLNWNNFIEDIESETFPNKIKLPFQDNNYLNKGVVEYIIENF